MHESEAQLGFGGKQLDQLIIHAQVRQDSLDRHYASSSAGVGGRGPVSICHAAGRHLFEKLVKRRQATFVASIRPSYKTLSRGTALIFSRTRFSLLMGKAGLGMLYHAMEFIDDAPISGFRPAPLEEIGPYRLIRLLGRGGMGLSMKPSKSRSRDASRSSFSTDVF